MSEMTVPVRTEEDGPLLGGFEQLGVLACDAVDPKQVGVVDPLQNQLFTNPRLLRNPFPGRRCRTLAKQRLGRLQRDAENFLAGRIHLLGIFLGELDAFRPERAGGFEPLRFIRPGTTVVLGLISSKLPALESQDDLRRRIDEAARYVPLDQLCLSPQCGFSSTVEGNDVAVWEERAKLSLCVELAREVWGGL